MPYKDVLKAADRIYQYIHRTPVLTSATIDRVCGHKLKEITGCYGRQFYFKCENFQKTGSFKARGALNAVLKLKEENPNLHGVVTHSSGNHGQAMAWAANMADVRCSVIVPSNTAAVKSSAIQEYGADLVFCEPTPQSREETCKQIAEQENLTIVPPFDHVDVIAGQGTVALEFLDQVNDLDAIIAPLSGGGMLAGIAIATKYVRPETKVYAVEPQGKNFEPCLRAGKRLWPNPPKFLDTVADSLRFQQPGHLNFPILCNLLEKDVFTVADEEMIDAMKWCWLRMKMIIEVSAAAGLAAVFSEKMKYFDPRIRRVGIVLSGGNVDLENLPWR